MESWEWVLCRIGMELRGSVVWGMGSWGSVYTQAEEANAAIKSKLGYRDDEELDTGVQKVQPLPFLGSYV